MKRFLIPIFVLFLSVYAFGAGSREPAPEPILFKVAALKGPTGIGMIQVFETPPSLPGGDSLQLEAIASADIMAAKLLSGELDAAVLPVNLAAKLFNSGLPYPIAAVVGHGMVSVLTTDPSVNSFEDLKGRETHVAGQGATPEYLMRTLAKFKGFDPDKDLTMVFRLPYPEIAASLVAGRINLAVLPEPFATQALMGNASARVPFSLDELWTEATGRPGYPMTVFVIRDCILKERPATARAFLDAYKASIEWVKANPKEAGVLVEKHNFGLKAPVAAAAIPRSAYVFLSAADSRKDVESLLSVFLETAPKAIGGKLPDGAFYAEIPRK